MTASWRARSQAPNGARYEGYDACGFWQELIADPEGSFAPEDVIVAGDRATIRWRYRFGEGEENTVRGVNLMHIRDGKIVEALGYVKAGLRSSAGRHDPRPLTPSNEETAATAARPHPLGVRESRCRPPALVGLAAGANALQANQRPKPRWSTLGPLSVSLRARIAPPSAARPR